MSWWIGRRPVSFFNKAFIRNIFVKRVTPIRISLNWSHWTPAESMAKLNICEFQFGTDFIILYTFNSFLYSKQKILHTFPIPPFTIRIRRGEAGSIKFSLSLYLSIYLSISQPTYTRGPSDFSKSHSFGPWSKCTSSEGSRRPLRTLASKLFQVPESTQRRRTRNFLYSERGWAGAAYSRILKFGMRLALSSIPYVKEEGINIVPRVVMRGGVGLYFQNFSPREKGGMEIGRERKYDGSGWAIENLRMKGWQSEKEKKTFG